MRSLTLEAQFRNIPKPLCSCFCVYIRVCVKKSVLGDAASIVVVMITNHSTGAWTAAETATPENRGFKKWKFSVFRRK